MAIFKQRTSMLSIACLATMAALLVLGGCYWKAKTERFTNRKSESLSRLLFWGARLRIAILVCVAATITLCIVDLFVFELSAGWPDRVVAMCATTLAALEYINYYHVQLQHFDHWPDFQRLIEGRGFRRSKMRADLDRYRNKQ